MSARSQADAFTELLRTSVGIKDPEWLGRVATIALNAAQAITDEKLRVAALERLAEIIWNEEASVMVRSAPFDTDAYAADVAAARALVTIRRRTGKQIPKHILALADDPEQSQPVRRRRRWWQWRPWRR